MTTLYSPLKLGALTVLIVSLWSHLPASRQTPCTFQVY